MTNKTPLTIPELTAIAKRVCTEKELDALAMHWAGHSHRVIADALKVSRSTVRSRLENANRKLKHELSRPEAA